MARKIINPKQPPILWSDVKEAFDDINSNFEEIYTTGGGGSGTQGIQGIQGIAGANLSSIDQDIIPADDVTYDLGSETKRFKDLYLSGNSIKLGSTTISSNEITGTVNFSGNIKINFEIDKGITALKASISENLSWNYELGIQAPASIQLISVPTDPSSKIEIFAFWQDAVPTEEGNTFLSVFDLNELTIVGNLLTIPWSPPINSIGNIIVSEINPNRVNVDPPVGPFPTGLIISESSQGSDIPAVYNPLLDENDFLIGIEIDSPGSGYSEENTETDIFIARGNPGNFSAWVYNISAVTDNINLPEGNYTASLLIPSGNITVNYSITNISVPNPNITKEVNIISFTQTIGASDIFAESNISFYIDSSNPSVLIPGASSNYSQILVTLFWTTNGVTLSVSGIIDSIESGEVVGSATQGIQGIQGIQGTSGEQGVQGTQGLSGESFNQGIQGIQGTSGEQGVQGTQGLSGESFNQGIQGIQGPQGIQGITGTTVLYTRTTVNGTATNLGDDATANLDITGFKGYALFKIQTSHAAWVRVYADAASRTSDSGRTQETDPLPGNGVIAEVITLGSETVLITPAPFGFNNENPVTNNIPVSVTNLSGSTNNITVTLTIVQIES